MPGATSSFYYYFLNRFAQATNFLIAFLIQNRIKQPIHLNRNQRKYYEILRNFLNHKNIELPENSLTKKYLITFIYINSKGVFILGNALSKNDSISEEIKPKHLKKLHELACKDPEYYIN